MIRPAQPTDLAAIVRLDHGTPEIAHWPELEYSAVLNNMVAPTVVSNLVRQIFVAEVESQNDFGFQNLYGFVMVKCMLLGDESLAEIENIAVDANTRRRSVGRALMESAIRWVREHQAARLQLEVRAGNEAAIALYRKLNFVEVGRRPGYYSQPVEDAVLLDLMLKWA
jgi:ribosomal-protein-alanine N-acetyltransferase